MRITTIRTLEGPAVTVDVADAARFSELPLRTGIRSIVVRDVMTGARWRVWPAACGKATRDCWCAAHGRIIG